MDLEFSDIRFPRRSCIGVTINMQQIAPTIALTPNFKYRRKMITAIYTNLKKDLYNKRDNPPLTV